ncbi:basal cell adhesion molecule-like isoform X2 [Polyodon spathula]|uniref:basal cell adhesion molecule-like isoform X2 n=1 Tax=Polyodon spathula TaxID=7913 RepID=UPI001B7DA575|nr:basal cell adhesion molecule-like isoform X2 [Polyodon spathula]
MKWVFGFVLLGSLHLASGKLSIVLKSPEVGPVLEGQSITLECLSDEDSDMSAYTFEKYAKFMDSWFAVDGSNRFRCWYYDVKVNRSAGRLQLQIPEVQSWNAGPFRCVQNNGTEQHSVSNSLSVPVHYLRDVSLFKDNSFYSRYSEQLKVLTVAPGSDVEVECSASASENPLYSWSREGDDWVEVSNKLKIQKVREEDAGTYTCTVQHPSVLSLSKTRSLQLLVVPEEERTERWLGLPQLSLFLMAGIPALVLIVVIVSLAVYLSRRKPSSLKGPIDDRSMKKPIYRGSVESVDSTVGDSHPLV